MEAITNTELAVLGLAAEGPRHGYQMEQDIELRGMRGWTEIGFSSIYYILNKLEKSGWLASELAAGSGPARRVYRLTAPGLEILRAAVYERLAHPRPRSADFDLALANLPALPAEAAREALRECRDSLAQRVEHVRAKEQADRIHMAQAGAAFPEHVVALFSHSLALMQAELDWISAYLVQFEQDQENQAG
jgi:DNA-binding PadR family transcriptional regulator